MIEGLGDILRKGLDTWRHNLILCIPFIAETVVSFILVIIALVAAIIFVIGGNTAAFEKPEQLAAAMAISLPGLIAIALTALFLIALADSFFTAGAIGMAKQAIESGSTKFGSMFEYGGRSFVSLFVINLIISIITILGVIFIIPGIMGLGNLDIQTLVYSRLDLLMPSLIILLVGLVLWGLYAIIISIVFAPAIYAAVVEGTGPIEGLRAGIGFFRSYKQDVFLLWLLILAINIVLGMIDIGVQVNAAAAGILSIIRLFINLIIIMPLTTVFWTRLYMTGTGKKVLP